MRHRSWIQDRTRESDKTPVAIGCNATFGKVKVRGDTDRDGAKETEREGKEKEREREMEKDGARKCNLPGIKARSHAAVTRDSPSSLIGRSISSPKWK